jgi:DNA replication and repair protein RecF
MKIKSLSADGFRNLSGVEIALSPGLNVFFGDNGQGKTNILECIWMMTGVRSFRGAKERELFGFEAEKITAGLQFYDWERLQDIAVELPAASPRRRKITVNGVPVPRLSKLFGRFQAVVFTPEDLALSGGEPAVRRAFLDLSVSQIKVSYASVLSRYNKILAQRNAYLKSLDTSGTSGKSRFDIEIWDTQLARAGAFLSVYRNVYIKTLGEVAGDFYRELSGGREKLGLAYRSGVYKDDIPETVETDRPEYYLERMRSRFAEDCRAGTTLVGVHRDDLILSVNGKPVREYGSQGQQRSAALALKLAGAQILALERCEPPVILLDDVLSELDPGRRRFLMGHLDGFQTLITACDDVAPEKGDFAKFRVKSGRVFEVN